MTLLVKLDHASVEFNIMCHNFTYPDTLYKNFLHACLPISRYLRELCHPDVNKTVVKATSLSRSVLDGGKWTQLAFCNRKRIEGTLALSDG